MTRLIALLLLTTGAIVVTTPALALDNNALYQWNTKDGTPTYSPDPPPDGVDYVVVDSDLKPLAVQPAKKPVAKSAPAPAIAAAIPPAAANPKWKPVRYAEDPSLAARRKKQKNSATPQTPEPQVVATETSTPVVSDECLLLRRETLILESSLEKAKSDSEMDGAILALHQKTMQYRKQCS